MRGEEDSGETRLVIRPGSVELLPAGRPRLQRRLTGAPLLPRDVEIVSPHAGRATLRVDGLDEELVLPGSALPTAIDFGRAGTLRAFSARSGPPARPRDRSDP